MAAMRESGHWSMSLQSWKALSDFFMRQPVSPRMTMRCGCALGRGNGSPPMLALTASAGSVASQVITGKSEGLESLGLLAVER